MKSFNVAIEETVVQEFKVNAINEKEALRIAEQKYKNEEFVLCSGEVQKRKMAVLDSSNDSVEWIKF